MRFDWIDFGLSWRENWQEGTGSFETLRHNSTASLLASLLRGRLTPFSKVFCWLRQQPGVSEVGTSPKVRHIERTFPFVSYDAYDNDRLRLFADWLVETVAQAPELGISGDEAESLKAQLAAVDYAFTRTDKLKPTPEYSRCNIVYHHTPTKLSVRASCTLCDGRCIERDLDDPPFMRDEMVYGRAIGTCFEEKGILRLSSSRGVL